jgi:hypothetical protein
MTPPPDNACPNCGKPEQFQNGHCYNCGYHDPLAPPLAMPPSEPWTESGRDVAMVKWALTFVVLVVLAGATFYVGLYGESIVGDTQGCVNGFTPLVAISLIAVGSGSLIFRLLGRSRAVAVGLAALGAALGAGAVFWVLIIACALGG